MLYGRGIDAATRKVTIIRHASNDILICLNMSGRGRLPYTNRFKISLYCLTRYYRWFFETRPACAVFLGVWKVKEVLDVKKALEAGRLAESFEPRADMSGTYHELEAVSGLEDLQL